MFYMHILFFVHERRVFKIYIQENAWQRIINSKQQQHHPPIPAIV